MQHAVHNRATIRVAYRTDVSGRITAGSMNDGARAKRQGSLWRICASAIFGCATSLGVFLAPIPAQADPGGVPAEIAALQAQVAALQSTVATLQTNNSALQSQVNALQAQLNAVQSNPALALGPFVSVDSNPENGVIGPNIKFTGANIHILSGSGATSDNGNPTGLGNLIIGYDDDKKFGMSILGPGDRGGSHNLVIGDLNKFTKAAFGGLVAGDFNAISNPDTACFGEENTASGPGSTVSGGSGNSATATDATVCGGIANTAMNDHSTVLGGTTNTASGSESVVIGGAQVTATNPTSIAPQNLSLFP